MGTVDRKRGTAGGCGAAPARAALAAGALFLLLVAKGSGGASAQDGRATASSDALTTARVAAARGEDGPVLLARRIRAMGTLLTGRVAAGDRGSAAAALEAAFEAVEAEEALLSSWRPESELSRLNRAPVGETRPVDPRLHALLAEARGLSGATGGAFDPAVGALVEAWDLRGEGRRPSGEELDAALAASGLDCFELDPRRPAVTRRCAGAWLDAGGFGKGVALRRAGEALREAGAASALLDFGGQMLAVGSPPEEEAWPVAVAHPAHRDRPVARLALRDRSAATTSSSERFVVVEGEVRGHVLDPRTGVPVAPWGSVTVVAADPLRADALSTALFVMGPRVAADWARGREDVGVLVLELEEDGEVAARWNDAMESFLTERPPRGTGPDGGVNVGDPTRGRSRSG